MVNKWAEVSKIKALEQELGEEMLDIEYDDNLANIHTAGSIENIWEFLDRAILSAIRDALYNQLFL
jgi:hypothetical protein